MNSCFARIKNLQSAVSLKVLKDMIPTLLGGHVDVLDPDTTVNVQSEHNVDGVAMRRLRDATSVS